MDIRVRPTPPPAPEPVGPTPPPMSNETPSHAKRPRWQKFMAGVLVLLALFFGFFAVKVLLATKDIITTNIGGGAAALLGGDLKGENDGRINILVLGIGGEGHDGPDLADTILLVSIDPKAKTVSMLGVPRDFYVKTPGGGYSKINAVNSYGEDNKVKGGGPALMKQTVSYITGVPVHYYVKIDFQGFKQVIDAVGGVEIKNTTLLYDPEYPCENNERRSCGYTLKPGTYRMNGAQALKYARCRKGTCGTDYGRSQRQQQVIQATRAKLLTAGTLANPAKVVKIIDAAGAGVRTDLQLWEMKKLLKIAEGIDSSKTQTKVLDPTSGVVTQQESPSAGSILAPTAGVGRYTQVHAWVRAYFTNSYLATEAAKLAVYNGTATPGLAAQAADFLKSYGYNVAVTGNAPAPQATTALYDYTGGKKPYTVKFLANRFGLTAQTRPAAEATDGSDIKLILGANFKTSQIAK